MNNKYYKSVKYKIVCYEHNKNIKKQWIKGIKVCVFAQFIIRQRNNKKPQYLALYYLYYNHVTFKNNIFFVFTRTVFNNIFITGDWIL